LWPGFYQTLDGLSFRGIGFFQVGKGLSDECKSDTFLLVFITKNGAKAPVNELFQSLVKEYSYVETFVRNSNQINS
jgi:hypothetical protein